MGGTTTVAVQLAGRAVALRAYVDGPTLWLLAGSPDAQWPIELLRAGSAQLTRDGQTERWDVELEGDPGTVGRILGGLREAVGDRQFTSWFPAPGRLIRLRPATATGGPVYDRWLRMEFDAAAPSYEERVRSNPYERAARDRSLAFLRETFRGRTRLLEIGPGPGIETVELLKDGHHVTAVDISSRMLDRLRERANAACVGERLATLEGRLDSMGIPSTPFDGAFSTFGALNCAPELRPTAERLAGALAPGAPVVAGIYNRIALSEVAAYALAGRPGRALARLRSPVRVGQSRFAVDWYPYSERDVAEAFRPWFEVTHTTGVGLLTPPPEIRRPWTRWPKFVDATQRWDRAVSRGRISRSLSDQLLVELIRNSVPPPNAVRERGAA